MINVRKRNAVFIPNQPQQNINENILSLFVTCFKRNSTEFLKYVESKFKRLNFHHQVMILLAPLMIILSIILTLTHLIEYENKFVYDYINIYQSFITNKQSSLIEIEEIENNDRNDYNFSELVLSKIYSKELLSKGLLEGNVFETINGNSHENMSKLLSIIQGFTEIYHSNNYIYPNSQVSAYSEIEINNDNIHSFSYRNKYPQSASIAHYSSLINQQKSELNNFTLRNLLDNSGHQLYVTYLINTFTIDRTLITLNFLCTYRIHESSDKSYESYSFLNLYKNFTQFTNVDTSPNSIATVVPESFNRFISNGVIAKNTTFSNTDLLDISYFNRLDTLFEMSFRIRADLIVLDIIYFYNSHYLSSMQYNISRIDSFNEYGVLLGISPLEEETPVIKNISDQLNMTRYFNSYRWAHFSAGCFEAEQIRLYRSLDQAIFGDSKELEPDDLFPLTPPNCECVPFYSLDLSDDSYVSYLNSLVYDGTLDTVSPELRYSKRIFLPTQCRVYLKYYKRQPYSKIFRLQFHINMKGLSFHNNLTYINVYLISDDYNDTLINKFSVELKFYVYLLIKLYSCCIFLVFSLMAAFTYWKLSFMEKTVNSYLSNNKWHLSSLQRSNRLSMTFIQDNLKSIKKIRTNIQIVNPLNTIKENQDENENSSINQSNIVEIKHNKGEDINTNYKNELRIDINNLDLNLLNKSPIMKRRSNVIREVKCISQRRTISIMDNIKQNDQNKLDNIFNLMNLNSFISKFDLNIDKNMYEDNPMLRKNKRMIEYKIKFCELFDLDPSVYENLLELEDDSKPFIYEAMCSEYIDIFNLSYNVNFAYYEGEVKNDFKLVKKSTKLNDFFIKIEGEIKNEDNLIGVDSEVTKFGNLNSMINYYMENIYDKWMRRIKKLEKQLKGD